MRYRGHPDPWPPTPAGQRAVLVTGPVIRDLVTKTGGRSLGLGVDARLLALLGRDRRRGAGQRVVAAARLGEGDHVADRVAAGQQGADAVPSERDAAVRRGAVLERLEQEAELLLG